MTFIKDHRPTSAEQLLQLASSYACSRHHHKSCAKRFVHKILFIADSDMDIWSLSARSWSASPDGCQAILPPSTSHKLSFSGLTSHKSPGRGQSSGSSNVSGSHIVALWFQFWCLL
ncbi:hypothetical protein PoB_005793600 [Plakobranchus ocellatus]|uniref:Uncharacterized protein n=1 Tax=Plakobranchus ocellatus TaxID=259542 RepID=A0AAV4CF81_9GAST|nr:hypothetical protein PoB_005793600 [Plakobranchus ocellatus]